MASFIEEALRQAQGAFAEGRLDESRRRCAQLMQAAPDDPQVLHLAAVLELTAGNAPAALSLVDRALRADAGDARQHHTRGLALRAVQRPREAVAAFREAVRLMPDFADAHAALGRALLAAGDPGSAALAFARAIEANPRSFDAHNDLGVAFLEQGRVADAEASFRRAIVLAPDRSHAWNNLGNALRTQGRNDEALAAFRGATLRKPSVPAAWVNLGNLLRERDDIEGSFACFERALEMAPSSAPAHLSAAIARLLDGDLGRGWSEYAWRNGNTPDASMAAALASLPAGTVVDVEGEQGLGDVLFFLRWAPRLAARGARVHLRADPRLFPLLERVEWIEAMHAPDDPPAEEALRVAVGDLPWLLEDAAEPYPPSIALTPLPDDVEAARRVLASSGPPPYVGIAWRAGIASSEGGEHLFKQVPLDELGAALKGVKATLVSLQRDPRPEESAALAHAAGRPLLDASALNADLPAMLGFLDAIDDYVGVSSTNVHLRAALGKGARILVPVPPEWRYGRSGAVSPWFPDFRLYREAREGGWRDALGTLGADLRERHGEAP
ncbi:MAG: tetratricopeptide repeat protein [Usitatibacter sp.]